MDNFKEFKGRMGLLKITYGVKYWKYGNFNVPCCTKLISNLDDSDSKSFFTAPDEIVYLPIRKTIDKQTSKSSYKVVLPNKVAKYFATIESIIEDPSQLNCRIVDDHRYINVNIDQYDQIITHKIYTAISINNSN